MVRNRLKFEKGYAEQRKNFEMLKNKIDEDDLTPEEKVKWQRVEELLDYEHEQS